MFVIFVVVYCVFGYEPRTISPDGIIGSSVSTRPELTQPLLDPDSGLNLVSLPSPPPVRDETQAKLTQDILALLGEGLEVGASGSIIYGLRKGEIKAFWSLDKFDNSRRPQGVSKCPEPLYQAKDFYGGERGKYILRLINFFRKVA